MPLHLVVPPERQSLYVSEESLYERESRPMSGVRDDG